MLEPMDLPAIWNVPYRRNEFFTGREDILTHLYRSLQADTAAALTQPQGMSGLGGIGKTQIALEYAYHYHADYQAVLWVRADSHSALVSGFVTIAHLLNLPEKDERDQNRAVQAVMRWFRGNTAWLLVFDNADDVAIVSEFLPTAHRGHILLTTRSRAMGQVAQPVEVEKMHPEVGAFFLLRRASLLPLQAHPDLVSDGDRKLAKEISQLMDGLPLALDQAGAYIKEISCSLSDYLDLYRMRAADLLKVRGSFDGDYPQSVATTWSLSFERVASANPASAELLHLCAFLYPDAIPEEIIVDGAANLGSILHPTAADPLQLDRALKEVLRFSLLQRESDAQTLTIHRLVQEVFKDRMDANRQYEWAERTVRAVNDAFPTVEFTTWPRCQRCILHAQACATLIEQWSMVLPEAARLLNYAGYYLQGRAQYKDVEHLYQQAIKISEQLHGEEHPDVATNLSSLATLYYEQGKYTETELLFKRVLAIRAKALEPEHLDMANIFTNTALLYNKQGKYAQAESLYQEALTIYEKVLGAEHIEIAGCLDNLAVLYHDLGKYTQAESLYLRALAIREQLVGLEHPEVAISLNNLALFYHEQGKYAQAELLYQRTLTIDERTLGTEHPEVAISLNNLALAYYVQGKYTQAEPLFQQALTIREKAFGPEHSAVANSLNTLALLYHDQGKYAEAKPLYERAIVIREHIFGPEHPHVAVILNNLALLYYELGNYSQAELLLAHALTIREQMLGPSHPDVAQSLTNLALLRRTQAKYEEAESLYQQAIMISEQILGREHYYLAASLNGLATLYRFQGKYQQAEPLYLHALAIREQALQPEHPDIAQTLNDLAKLYDIQGKYRQAEPLSQRAAMIYKRVLGPEHPTTVQVMENYARLQEKMKRDQETAGLETPEAAHD